jgi:hypothetical protein
MFGEWRPPIDLPIVIHQLWIVSNGDLVCRVIVSDFCVVAGDKSISHSIHSLLGS